MMRHQADALAPVFPALVLFAALQALDAGTTLIGLRLGAQEASPFVSHLIGASSPVAGLAACKALAFALAGLSLAYRPRVLRWINVWFGALVLWNIGCIVFQCT